MTKFLENNLSHAFSTVVYVGSVRRVLLWLLVSVLCFLCVGCGYRFGNQSLVDRFSTIGVPYIEGDDQGFLTQAVIHEIAYKGVLPYRVCGADLLLKVCLLQPTNENIGYTFATTTKKKIVVANEARLTISAKVTLVNAASGKALAPPVVLSSALSYDFEPDLSTINFHDFALGQLETQRIAEEDAMTPLYALLAQKIVDYVNNTW